MKARTLHQLQPARATFVRERARAALAILQAIEAAPDTDLARLVCTAAGELRRAEDEALWLDLAPVAP